VNEQTQNEVKTLKDTLKAQHEDFRVKVRVFVDDSVTRQTISNAIWRTNNTLASGEASVYCLGVVAHANCALIEALNAKIIAMPELEWQQVKARLPHKEA
jgi:hypothetical protein